jgi:hypothetical protein
LLPPVPVGYDLAKLFLTFVIAGREFGAEQLEIGWRTYAAELPESFRASLSRQSTLILLRCIGCPLAVRREERLLRPVAPT